MHRFAHVLAVALIGMLVCVGWDALTVMPKSKVKITHTLSGQEAEASLQTLAAKHPGFKQHMTDADAAWAAKGHKREVAHTNVMFFSAQRGQSWLQRLVPRLHAQEWDENDGYVVWTGYGGNGDGSQYYGSVYIELYGYGYADSSADWTVDTTTADVVWVGRDRGDYICHTRQICRIAPNGGPKREGMISKLLHNMNPVVVAAACGCTDLVHGTGMNCILRNALSNARAACGIGVIRCAWSGAAFGGCFAEWCGAGVGYYFVAEFADFVQSTYQGC